MLIGIIGGGITGLSTALALRKRGIQSVVYEQAQAFNEVGAGIWIQPNAIKVLNWLGIADRIKDQGIELKKVEITNNQLSPFKKMERDIMKDTKGNRAIAIHRAALQKILFQEAQPTIEIRFNKKYLGHTSHADGITIQFADGTEEVVNVLLGADGINSLVRQSILPYSVLRSSGQVCWRGVSEINLPERLKYCGKEAWGRQIRFGFSQINAHEVYWFAVAKEKHINRIEKSGKKEYITELFKDFSPVISSLIANTDSKRIHQTILHDLKKLPSWYQENVCLLGDAAHATTPNMGQGACQGIEDAYYISKYLSKSPVNAADAFRLFEIQRREKVDYVVNTSWQLGKMAHSFFGQALVRLILRLTPERMIASQMNKLYHIE